MAERYLATVNLDLGTKTKKQREVLFGNKRNAELWVEKQQKMLDDRGVSATVTLETAPADTKGKKIFRNADLLEGSLRSFPIDRPRRKQ